jgi:hypothetical protein
MKTTVDFGEEGIPLERFDEVMQALREARQDLGSKASRGFVPISFDRYVSLYVKSNPRVDKGWGAMCLWSADLGDRVGGGRRRMFCVHHGRGVAGRRLRDR